MSEARAFAFPSFADKHDLRSAVTPADRFEYRRFVGHLDGLRIPTAIVICFQASVLSHPIASRHAAGDTEGELFRGVRTLPRTDHTVGVLGGFGFGAPSTALLMEDFIPLGVRRFIAIGTAGSLQPQRHRLGEIVVCTDAIRDEGVSHNYLPPSIPAAASPSLTDDLRSQLHARSIPHAVGSAWTTNTPYRDTTEEVKAYARNGVACVDMEAAAIFAVARYRNVEAASAFVISDIVHESYWDLRSHDEDVHGQLAALGDAAVATLSSRVGDA